MERATGIVAGTLAAGIWGGMYVVSKVVLDVIPPFTLLSMRLILASLAVAVLICLRGEQRAALPAVARSLAVGLIGFGFSLGLQFVGTRLSTASLASLITSASPVFMVLFASIILGEKASLRRMGALGLAILGVVLVIDPRSMNLSTLDSLGNLALLGAAITWGLYSVLIKQASQTESQMNVVLFTFLGGLLLSLPLSYAETGWMSIEGMTAPIWLGVLYLGLVSTALALALWAMALARLEAGIVSLLFFAQPIVGVGLGAWLLGEQLSVSFWLGALAMGAGLLLAVSERKVPAPV
jgi:drug/metabolite transporter (DMT)-like permease